MTEYDAQSWRTASGAMEAIVNSIHSISSGAENATPLSATSLSPIDMEIHKGLYQVNTRLAEISRAVKARADQEVIMLDDTGVEYARCNQVTCDIAERIWS